MDMLKWLHHSTTSNSSRQAASKPDTDHPPSPKFVGAVPLGGATSRIGASFSKPQHRKNTSSSSSGWTASTASDSTALDSSFSGFEPPASPADIAPRYATGITSAARSEHGRQQPQQPQQQQQQQQQQQKGKHHFRRWGRRIKEGPELCRSSSSDTPSETERKRKATRCPPLVSLGEATAAGAATASGTSMNVAHSQPPGHGRMVDRFQILNTLGTGYSGKVKKAIDTYTGQMVALKVMDKLPTNDPTSARKFNRLLAEVEAMKKCGNHPHTVQLHDAMFNATYPKRDGTSVTAHVLVLELCEKGELLDLMCRGGSVPNSVSKEYFRQMMVGISYCHSKEVVHRDLKPENLLLDSNFALKIADFGFAATGRGPMMCHSIVGSTTYMSPEVLSRRKAFPNGSGGYNGALADVWSAGVILFMMIAGHPPMEKADETDWWFRALKLGRQDLFWKSHENTAPDFPEDAKHLVTLMLTVDPANRIPVPQIMQHPYLIPAAAASSRSRGGLLSRRNNQPLPPSAAVPSEVLMSEMQRRYELSMASKRLCTVTSSSRGTADSAGTTSGSEGPVPAAAGAGAAAAGGGGGGGGLPPAGAVNGGAAFAGAPYYGGAYNPAFLQRTWRGPDDGQDVGPPVMSADKASKVTGGFMANGSPRDVVKALERVLFDMGAEIDGVSKDGARTFRSSYKVSAGIPADEKIGGGPVGMVATVFRVSREESRKEEAGAEIGMDGDERGGAVSAELVVVLRRKGGDYFRYRKVEDALVSRLTTPAIDKEHPASKDTVINMSPTP